MNVALSPTLEKEVAKLLKGGRYGNQSEVMRAGLRLLLDAEECRKEVNTKCQKSESKEPNAATDQNEAAVPADSSEKASKEKAVNRPKKNPPRR